MKINEAVKQGIGTLTRKEWARGRGRVTLHLIQTDDGFKYGPWATVEDNATDVGVIEPQKVFVLEMPDDGWLEWDQG